MTTTLNGAFEALNDETTFEAGGQELGRIIREDCQPGRDGAFVALAEAALEVVKAFQRAKLQSKSVSADLASKLDKLAECLKDEIQDAVDQSQDWKAAGKNAPTA